MPPASAGASAALATPRIDPADRVEHASEWLVQHLKRRWVVLAAGLRR